MSNTWGNLKTDSSLRSNSAKIQVKPKLHTCTVWGEKTGESLQSSPHCAVFKGIFASVSQENTDFFFFSLVILIEKATMARNTNV